MLFIHRILSAVWLVLVVMPLHILWCTITLIAGICNQLCYFNFWEHTAVPDVIYEKFGKTPFIEIMARINVIIIHYSIAFLNNIKQLKLSKF